ncbi:hypothetical protein KVR01_008127 [Diaporthe batatas]|uniref:uncharacterized protein n=1 Tax=Diaporthe batatas TaxID=748121 RepID=UPI001D05B844|nr:uncharacterized protein KVR01_008127 [Diaporthe batatas]KAG8162362.1 hypothetical protein KVR01_008127 [Diaporthe batatas]
MEMESRTPFQSSGLVWYRFQQKQSRLAMLPTELLEMVVGFLVAEPNGASAASDERLKSQRDLFALSLVCREFTQIASSELYKVAQVVHIATDAGLESFLRTVARRRDVAQITQTLSLKFKLCGDNLSGPKNHDLCSMIYEILYLTKGVKLLELDLKECTCCVRNSSPQHLSTGYDSLAESLANRLRDETNLSLGDRTFLPGLRDLRYDRNGPCIASAYPVYLVFALLRQLNEGRDALSIQEVIDDILL